MTYSFLVLEPVTSPENPQLAGRILAGQLSLLI